MAKTYQADTEKTIEKDRQTPLSSEMEKYSLPSNQDYLSYYVYQEEWKPTRPLRPIGAVFGSPGPAIVNLPSTIGAEKHDPTKTKAPSYKMGQKLPRKLTVIGPGPEHDINGICKVTNMGKENCRAPKIGTAERFRDKADVRSPGPAAYNRDSSDKSVFPSTPSFSMSHSRRGGMKIPISPAPNAYLLPSGIGSGKTPLIMGPAYSMGKAKRMPDAKLETNPGPAAYMLPPSHVTMGKSPGFYIGTKATPPVSTSSSPGPGAYGAHLVKFDKYSTPRITFGIRHSPFKTLPGFAAEK